MMPQGQPVERSVMKTKILMTASALFLFVLGITLTFLPQETLIYLGSGPAPLPVLLVQAAGALYLGFAFLNWTARGMLIGGIYNRPVSLGNFLHFAAGAAALVKGALGGHTDGLVLSIAVIYLVLAVWFGKVVFTHPLERAASG
jgi:hypothetical protein